MNNVDEDGGEHQEHQLDILALLCTRGDGYVACVYMALFSVDFVHSCLIINRNMY